MNDPAAVSPANGAPVLAESKGRAVLRAENLRRVFVDGERELEVLKGVNLSLQSGTVACLVGRSGSGKSTLLHLMGLLDWPDGGEVLIDGTPAGNLGERDRAFLRNRHIGFVFQHFFLLPEFTVLENVLMPLQVGCSFTAWRGQREASRKRAAELLEQVGLSAQAGQYPPTLSGGERQRAAVARALVAQPKILLCDEPTGNLDPETGAHIIDLLISLSRQGETAVLVVTHDRSVADRADRLFRLDQGRLSVEK